LNVLLAAYACNPRQGSEEGVGWEWANLIAKDHEVMVVTAAFHRNDIESITYIKAHLRFVYVPHRKWHYSPTPAWKVIETSLLKPIMNLAYARWQQDAFRLARELIREKKFDLVHQATYVGYRFPGRLWRLGLPFVWGPVGGLENTEWNLLPAMGSYGAIYYGGRNLINSAQRRWLRSPQRAALAAGPGLIAATGGIARDLKSLYGADSTVLSEVTAPIGLSPATPRRRASDEPLQLVWSGQHLPGKALNIVLLALARVPRKVNWRLDVLGDGPLCRRWRELADAVHVSSRCHWRGMLPRTEALDVMSRAHILIISSLKDLTSTVLLEGLTLGLPIICPDYCGFSDVVTAGCGLKISPRGIEDLVAGFAMAIESLADDESLRYRLADGALRRARDYTSERKREQLNRIYERVLIEFNEARAARCAG
jgi:glycosyltransferase involved in cell wall biosynthesis